MKSTYQILLVSTISILVITMLVFRIYILLIPIILSSLYLIKETRIPEVKDTKTFYEYVKKVYGNDLAHLIMQKFNIIQGDATTAFFPSSMPDNTVILSDNSIIIKVGSNTTILSKYEGIDRLIDIIKNSDKHS
ncbi:MAG: hypothetical protein QXR34_09985 [Saccharolobus sp.]